MTNEFKLIKALCEKLGYEVVEKKTKRLTGERFSGLQYTNKAFRLKYPDKLVADEDVPGYVYDGHIHIYEESTEFTLVAKTNELISPIGGCNG